MCVGQRWAMGIKRVRGGLGLMRGKEWAQRTRGLRSNENGNSGSRVSNVFGEFGKK